MTNKTLLYLLLVVTVCARAQSPLDQKDAAIRASLRDERAVEREPNTPVYAVRLLRARQAVLLAAADYDTELSRAYRKFADDLGEAQRRAFAGGEARGRAVMETRFVLDSVRQLENKAGQVAALRTDTVLASDAMRGAATALNERLSGINRRRQRVSAPAAEDIDLDLGIERVQALASYFEINAELERTIAATYGAQASRRDLLLSREATQVQISNQIDDARSEEWRKTLPAIVPELWWSADKLGDSAAEQRARTEANILLRQGKK
jgi:hypothetical protein